MNDEAREAARSKAFAITFPGPTEPRGWAEHYFEVGFDAGYEAGQAAQQQQWHEIRSAEDLPKEHGIYFVTWKVGSMTSRPHVTQFRFDEVYRERFWLGSVAAWKTYLPEPFVKEKP
jgi:hypothetical protein